MIEENGKVLYQKKDYVYADTLGVCRVEEVTNLAIKNATPTQYYGLRSMQHESTTAYFPVENHEVNIRTLISEEEAMKILELSDEEKKEMDEKLLFEALFVIKYEKNKKAKIEKKNKK